MASKPDEWHFTSASMATQLNVGVKTVRGALQELRSEGWLEFSRSTKGEGIYTIHHAVTRAATPRSCFGPGPNGSEPKGHRISNKDTNSKKEHNKEKGNPTPSATLSPSENAMADWVAFEQYYSDGIGLSGGSQELFLEMSQSDRETAIMIAHKSYKEDESMTYSAVILKRVIQSEVDSPLRTGGNWS